ncbi:MAG: transglycosylase domain-containing protein [Bdellovibrionales bacterium]|nr:transglycosylase domain-containing protein [Bdellovibrionales bacterium]
MATALLVVVTRLSLEPLPATLAFHRKSAVQIYASDGTLLTAVNQPWNVSHERNLWQLPALLREAFIQAEDKRFFEHSGVDWTARLSALWANVTNREVVRGASTISEQVVKMLHPRPRSYWSRWVEGWEARALSKQFSKAEILEFYLNQVPYVGTRRGVAQAADHYFGRSVETLSSKELLALVVLVRAPSALDLRKGTEGVERRIVSLADRMVSEGRLDRTERVALDEPLLLEREKRNEGAMHFANAVRRRFPRGGVIRTTLDHALQAKIQRLLDERVRLLGEYLVGDGAAIVLDNQEGSALAWVNAGSFWERERGAQVDAVEALRQPGSTLKPFFYAEAIRRGWTDRTLVNDEPYLEAVGNGLHEFRNYSRTHYGLVSVREALGNSLNVPAIRAAEFVGIEPMVQRLREFGFRHLTAGAQHYGKGLSLGNGEVTLLELAEAYRILARGGLAVETKFLANQVTPSPRRVLDETVAATITDILADPHARHLEFGSDSVLDLPVECAVKTGTSQGYRDAWAVGYTRRHTVAVWMGNQSGAAMRDVSGAFGPALVLRSIFAELNRFDGAGSLLRGGPRVYDEHRELPVEQSRERLRIVQPVADLHLAMDPRIPDQLEAFTFQVRGGRPFVEYGWEVNGEVVATTAEPRLSWPLSRGSFALKVLARSVEGHAEESPRVFFSVK